MMKLTLTIVGIAQFVSFIIAQTAQPQTYDWVQFGVMGLFVSLFVFDRVYSKGTVDRLSTQHTEAITRLTSQLTRREAQLDRMIASYEDDVIPALIESNRVAGEMLRRAERERDQR